MVINTIIFFYKPITYESKLDILLNHWNSIKSGLNFSLFCEISLVAINTYKLCEKWLEICEKRKEKINVGTWYEIYFKFQSFYTQLNNPPTKI